MTAPIKIAVLAAILCVLTTPVFACEPCKTGYTEVNGVCKPNPTPKPTPTPVPAPTSTTTNTNTNTNANTNNNSNVNANTNKQGQSQNQGQKQGQQQTQTANGGNASSNSTATGGAANSTAAATNNSSGNSTSVSNNTANITNNPRQTPMAYAPDTLSTSPCVIGFSGGGAGPMGSLSLGISRVDKGCDSRQTAVIFHGLGNDYASAKILCSTNASKRAHLTLEECQRIVVNTTTVVSPALPVATAPQPIIIQLPPTPVVPPVVMPPQSFSSTITNIGECPVSQWNCVYRLLDKAVLGVQSGANSKIVLTGPPSTARVIQYLHNRGVDSARVSLNFQDINSVSVETFSINQQ